MASLITALLFLLHLVVAARAITRPGRTPASRVAWVAVIMAVPLAGMIGYLLLGETNIGRKRVRELNATRDRLALPHAYPAPTSALFDLGASINGFPATTGNRITVLGAAPSDPHDPRADSRAAVDAMIEAIDAAQSTVHLSFYIWLNDDHGGRMVDAVCAAAARGVTCRVMVDALGSRAFIKSPRWKQLRDAGVGPVANLNDIPRLGHLPVGRLDLRNHRKIAVIDNEIAFCGSQNCADPEFRVLAKYAPWVDLWLRCEGPVVQQEQYLFLMGWIAETGEEGLYDVPALPSESRLVEVRGAPATSRETEEPDTSAIAQMFGTGPTTPGNAMSDMFVATIYSAHEELVITTPYFVPDEALERALCAAPRRGVRTTVIFPARNNSMLVAAACRSTYADLLAAGVQVFEYPLGLLHTKSITVDGEVALVGSANMDRRSLELNFENNLLVADRDVVAAVRARQDGYLSVSSPVSLDDVRTWPWWRRLAQNTIGMLSPLL